jgi:hypothetical protein
LSSLRNTIPILFNGGAYGTYLEWALTTLSTDIPVESPITNISNSHRFSGNQLINIEGWREFVKQNQFKKFVRLHPKTKKDQSLTDTIKEILDNVEYVIHLYPDPESVLLNINNCYKKVWTDWWTTQFNSDISPEKIYQNWPIDRNTPITEVPIWIRREFLSFYLVPAWQNEVEWYYPDRCNNNRIRLVLIKDLLYNFENTILKIQSDFNLTFTKPISSILTIHNQMLSAQKAITQDQTCCQIIQSVINEYDFDWEELPLVSQSWVQWRLRNLNFEIQCDGLDIFPTNSVQLKKLLYRTI